MVWMVLIVVVLFAVASAERFWAKFKTMECIVESVAKGYEPTQGTDCYQISLSENNGTIRKFDVEQSVYESLLRGDRVRVTFHEGIFLGTRHGMNMEKIN